MSLPTSGPSNVFLPRLEAMRGAGAWMVVAVHAAQSPWAERMPLLGESPDWQHPIWGTLFRLYFWLCNGHGALIVFFVLSGYVLAASMDRGPRELLPAARRFFTGRVFRLYPAIISTIAIFAILYWTIGARLPSTSPDDYRLIRVLRNMLLVETKIDGVMWTLQLEAIAIPLIFVVVIAQRRFGLRATLPVALVFFALSFWGKFTKLIPEPTTLGPLYTFVLGVAIHRLGPALMGRLRPAAVSPFFFAMVALFFIARPILGLTSKWSPLFECFAAVGIVSVIAYGGATSCARIFDWPPFRFYGRISYSFYLLHPLTLIIIWQMPAVLAWLLAQGVPGVLIAFVLGVASTLAITPLAWLSWRYVEVPGIVIGKRLLPRRQGKVEASVQLPVGTTW